MPRSCPLRRAPSVLVWFATGLGTGSGSPWLRCSDGCVRGWLLCSGGCVRCLRRHQQIATDFSNCGQGTLANANRTDADASNLLAAFPQRGASPGKNFTRSPRVVGQGPPKAIRRSDAHEMPTQDGLLSPCDSLPFRPSLCDSPKAPCWSPTSSRPSSLASFSLPSSLLVCCAHSIRPAASPCYGVAPFQSHIGRLALPRCGTWTN